MCKFLYIENSDLWPGMGFVEPPPPRRNTIKHAETAKDAKLADRFELLLLSACFIVAPAGLSSNPQRQSRTASLSFLCIEA